MTAFNRDLIAWYKANRIPYPWRLTADPYRIWVSEILLQQTRISVALPFYKKIVELYPTFYALAEADPAEFLAAWSGIGYYRRAENMLLCARQLVKDHGGKFPSDAESLRKLAGIGSYTVGAIRNLCFGHLTPALDGNVSRVMARLVAYQGPASGRDFQNEIAQAFMKHGRNAEPADYMQALMELGEQVCLPNPNCAICPVIKHCAAAKRGLASKIPVPVPRAKQKQMYWYFLLLRKGPAYFFVQNSARAFLKNAWLFPDLLSEHPLSTAEVQRGFSKRWKIKVGGLQNVGEIRHTVTFRRILGQIFDVLQPVIPNVDGLWLTPAQLKKLHTSSVAFKILNKNR